MSSAERITADELLEILATFDALETFCRLPQADQDNFSRWVGQARDNESHWRRIQALVLAMRVGPMQPHIRREPAHIWDRTK